MTVVLRSPALPERMVELLNELSIGQDWTRTVRPDGAILMEKTMLSGRQCAVLLLPPGMDERVAARRLS